VSKPHLFSWNDLERIARGVWFHVPRTAKEAIKQHSCGYYSGYGLKYTLEYIGRSAKKGELFPKRLDAQHQELFNFDISSTLDSMRLYYGREYIREETTEGTQNRVKRAFKYVEMEKAVEWTKEAYKLGQGKTQTELTERLLKYIVDKTLETVERLVDRTLQDVVQQIEYKPVRDALPPPDDIKEITDGS